MKSIELSVNKKVLKIKDDNLTEIQTNFFENYDEIEDLEITMRKVIGLHERDFRFFRKLIKITITAESLEYMDELCFTNLNRLKYLSLNTPKLISVPYLRSNYKLICAKLYVQHVTDFDYIFITNFYLKHIDLVISIASLPKSIFKNNSLPFLDVLSIENLHVPKTWIPKRVFYSLYYVLVLKLKKVNLGDRYFVRKNVFKLVPHVRKLTLIECSIRDISFLKHLKRLKELDLSNNLISWTTNAFVHNLSLESINLSFNHFIILQNSLSQLPELFYVNLSGCSLRELNSTYFQTCENKINFLNLSMNSIGRIQVNFFDNFINLTNLNLCGNNLTSMKRNIFTQLTKLNYLNLQYNLLSSLEFDIFSKLFDLKNLILSYNSLMLFYANFFDINSNYNVEYLSLNNNKISTLYPNNFRMMPSLKFLNLSTNHIAELHDYVFMNLEHLTDLDLRCNEIRKLSKNMFQNLTSLRTLVLKSNYIGTLEHGAFDHLTSLTMLDLERNWIENLTPNLFSYNTHLRHINFNCNRITKIPQKIFHYNYKLKYVSVSHNFISKDDFEEFRRYLKQKITLINDTFYKME